MLLTGEPAPYKCYLNKHFLNAKKSKSCRSIPSLSSRLSNTNKVSIRTKYAPQSFQIGGDVINAYDMSELKDILIHNSYIIGEYIGYFVLFYAALNWMTYRRIRKLAEEQNKKKK